MAQVSIPHRYAENGCNESRGIEAPGFQFLIGTLRTHPPRAEGEAAALVSIPHRYAENIALALKLSVKDGEFQFLIGTLRTRRDVARQIQEHSFQFLIGTLRTSIWRLGVLG